MSRTVTNTTKFMTVGDLRRFLNSEDGMKMNENAFIWIPNGEESWNIDCATDVAIEKVTCPEDGHPEEAGLCIYAKKVRNKESE